MASILRHLLASLEPQPHVFQPGPFDLQILGDPGFVAAVSSALEMLQRDCPDYHRAVVDHVAVIEPSGRGTGGKHQEPPRIVLESSPGSGSDLSPHPKAVWYAGIIAREAWRSKLERENPQEAAVPGTSDKTSAGGPADDYVRIQLEVLRRLDAPQWMLDYVGFQQ